VICFSEVSLNVSFNEAKGFSAVHDVISLEHKMNRMRRHEPYDAVSDTFA
jgi:hypothetical protein